MKTRRKNSNLNTGKHKGKMCSGWRIFPDGAKCKGCPDCYKPITKLKTKKR